MIGELWREVLHEVTSDWLKLLIELVQFAILAVIIKVVAFGAGTRRGVVSGMVSSHAERVRAQLAEAEAREGEAAEAPERAKATVAEAKRATRHTIAEARRAAAGESTRILKEADEQVADLERRTEDALSREREEALAAVREMLPDIVARGAREMLDEGYPAEEQRRMMEAAILDSIGELDAVTME